MADSIARPWACMLAAVLSAVLPSCYRSPPPSQFPTARAALARMRATYECSRGVQGEAAVDYFGDDGRIRGNVLYFAVLPEQLRFDIYSPFGIMLTTLTSDGNDFALFDLKEKQFLYGPSSGCNVARFTRVPVPPHALVQLLRGEAPVLVHDPARATIGWETGCYVVRIHSRHAAREEIRIEPTPADWQLPWRQQRVRVLQVAVEQHGIELYRAELSDHRVARTAQPRVDPDGIDPDILPSGPVCRAEVPRSVRLLVPDTDQDLLLLNKEVSHNPPLIEGVFRQRPPRGVTVRYAACTD